MKSKPQQQKEPQPRADVEVGDHLYVHHQGQPCTGVVHAHGKHGVTVEVDGKRHQVKWDKVLGHKKRAQQRYTVIEQGEDGMLVEDAQGKRRFVAVPNEAKDDPMVAKSFGQRPVLLFMKANGAPPSAGLSKKQITDKNGVQTTRWVSTAAGGPPAQKGQHVGFQNGDHKGHGEVTAAGQHGVTVKDAAGGEHRVHHEKITHHWQGDGAPDASPHKNELEDAAAETESRRGQAKKLAEGKDAVELKHPDGKRYALAGKDASKPGGYRITHFDEKGPIGHGERASLEDAVHSGLEAGYEAVQPDKNSTKPFFDEADIKDLPHPKKFRHTAFKNWEEAEAKAPEARDQFHAILKGLGQKLGFEEPAGGPDEMTPEMLSNDKKFMFMGPIKKQSKSTDKVMNDYKGDWGGLKDLVRATVAVKTVDDVHNLLAGLKESGVKMLQQPKDNMTSGTPDGYRDINLILAAPNGMPVELQVQVKAITKAKSEGHEFYNENIAISQRNADKENFEDWSPKDRQEFAKNRDAQKRIYGKAWAEATGMPNDGPAATNDAEKQQQTLQKSHSSNMIIFVKGVRHAVH